MSHSPQPARWLPFVVLGIGLAAISFGAIFARLAQAEGVSSLAVATWRLGFAALIITPVALLQSRHELARLTRRQIGMALAAGFFLALHFATWFSSLEYTSVASSTALVTTNPLWIGLASFLIFRETPTKMMIGGIALSFAGSLFIFWSDSQSASAGSNPMLGNLLALIGSWCFSAYLLIGRRLRAGLGLPAYIWLAYGAAALFLFAASGAGGVELFTLSNTAWLVLLAMALGPQLLGQSAYNWSLRQVSPTIVAVVTLGETVGSAMLAWILEHDGHKPGFLIGGVPLNFGVSARLGEGRFVVVEADEYDTAFFDKRAKFVHYRPRTAILHNLEHDHADIYPDVAAIQRQFHLLLRAMPGNGRLVVTARDRHLAEVLEMGCWTPVERYAVDPPPGGT